MPRTRGLDRDLVYLLLMTKKHNVTPASLYTSMLAARERGKVKCGKISIEMRRRGESSSTYMFSVEGRPLAQAEIQNDSIRKLRNPPDEFRNFLHIEEQRNINQPDSNGERNIRDLRFGLRGVSFKAKVVKKSSVRAVTSKDGNPLLVCSVTLSDGTGEIPLAVWNSQIASVSEGDVVQVHDARVRSFRGEIQLSLNRKTGALTVLEAAVQPKIVAISN